MSTMRNSHAYVQRRDALKRATAKNGWGCHLCGKPIDLTLPYTDRMSWTADHVLAVAGEGKGRMLGELRPAH